MVSEKEVEEERGSLLGGKDGKEKVIGRRERTVLPPIEGHNEYQTQLGDCMEDMEICLCEAACTCCMQIKLKAMLDEREVCRAFACVAPQQQCAAEAACPAKLCADEAAAPRPGPRARLPLCALLHAVLRRLPDPTQCPDAFWDPAQGAARVLLLLALHLHPHRPHRRLLCPLPYDSPLHRPCDRAPAYILALLTEDAREIKNYYLSRGVEYSTLGTQRFKVAPVTAPPKTDKMRK